MKCRSYLDAELIFKIRTRAQALHEDTPKCYQKNILSGENAQCGASGSEICQCSAGPGPKLYFDTAL